MEACYVELELRRESNQFCWQRHVVMVSQCMARPGTDRTVVRWAAYPNSQQDPGVR